MIFPLLLLIFGVSCNGLRLNPFTSDGPLRYDRRQTSEYLRNLRLEQTIQMMSVREAGPDAKLVALRDKMESMRNQTAEPCQDFFEYACGGWIEKNTEEELPAAFATAEGIFEYNIKELVMELSKDETFLGSELHQQCLRDLPALLEKPRNPYIASLFQDIRAVNEQTLGIVLGGLAVHGVPAFFEHQYPTPWILNASTNYHLPLAPYMPYLPDDDWFLQHISDVFTNASTVYGQDFFPEDGSVENATAGTYRVFQVLKAQYEASEERFRAVGQNISSFITSGLLQRFDMKTLQKRAPLPWLDIFTALGIERANDFILYDPIFFSNISAFLGRSLAMNSTREDISYYLSYIFLENFQAFPLIPNGNEDIEYLCKEAYSLVLSPLQFPLYANKYISQKLSDTIDDLLVQIVSQFEQNLPSISWLDDATRAAALLKAQMFGINIGGPNLADFPFPTFVATKNYFLSYFETLKGIQADLLSRVSTPVARKHEEWALSLFARSPVNAFYDPTQNGIFIQAPIMFPDFFDSLNPLFSQYAGIGTVLGHEMTHGFDNSGAQFDEYGSFRDWWSASSKTKFNEIKQCIIDFYSNADYHTEYNDGNKLNGKLTQGENIADFGGLKFSYLAWKQALKEGKALYSEAQIQSVFNKTSEQLYFESYAQLWCANPPHVVYEDPHSSPPMRVLGPLSHFEPFRQAYECKPGDVYYPSPCQIW